MDYSANERVAIVRKKLKIKQTDFAKSLSISQQALSMIENGQRELTQKNARLICYVYNVNYAWLMGQTDDPDDMFDRNDGDAQAIVDSVMTGDNEFAKKMIVRFASLGEERWKQLKEIMEQMLEE